MVPQNGWNKVEQDWNGIQAIMTDHSDHIAPPLMPKCGPMEVPNWIKRVKNSIYWVQVVHGASKWLEQGATSFERYTGHQD